MGNFFVFRQIKLKFCSWMKCWHILWQFQLEITCNKKVIAKKPLTNWYKMNSRTFSFLTVASAPGLSVRELLTQEVELVAVLGAGPQAGTRWKGQGQAPHWSTTWRHPLSKLLNSLVLSFAVDWVDTRRLKQWKQTRSWRLSKNNTREMIITSILYKGSNLAC